MTNRSAAEKTAREIALHFKDEGVSCNEGWILLMADIIERACGQPDSPLTPYGEELQQKSFRDGLRAMRLLIREELDKKDAAMKHGHNPAVLQDAQWEYCWRCRIERVLNSEIGSYHELCGDAQ